MYIENYDSNAIYTTDFKPEQKSFGLTWIEAIKLVKSIIKLGILEYTVNFNSTIRKLLEFSLDYPWNSALHKLTEEILCEILRSNSKYPEDFWTLFIEDIGLLEFLVDLKAFDEHEVSKRKVRTGMVANFLVVANILDGN